MGSLEPAAIRLTLECLQESARRSMCFLIINFKYIYIYIYMCVYISIGTLEVSHSVNFYNMSGQHL